MMVAKSPNNQSGFSFIEVVIAVIVFSSMITALFALQGRMLKRATEALYSWESVVAIKNYMYEADQKGYNQKTQEHKKEVPPAINVTYRAQKIKENSVLKKEKQLRSVRATAHWNLFGFDRQETLVNFAVVPDPVKKKGDKK